jgi:hypothetical protein
MPILIIVNPGIHMAAGIILFTVVHTVLVAVVHKVLVIVVHMVDAVKCEVVDYLENRYQKIPTLEVYVIIVA